MWVASTAQTRLPLASKQRPRVLVRQAGLVSDQLSSSATACPSSPVHFSQAALQRGVAQADGARVGVRKRKRRLRLDCALVHLAHLERGQGGERRAGVGQGMHLRWNGATKAAVWWCQTGSHTSSSLQLCSSTRACERLPAAEQTT